MAAEWARADSSLTHPHQVCQDACAVFVAAIATTIDKGSTARECYEAACDEARLLMHSAKQWNGRLRISKRIRAGY